MFLKTRWYMAALSNEVTRFAPVARTYLGEKVVLFRTIDNTPVALEDRCPHRFSPLSLGRTTRDGIACVYHGMTFNRDGVCTSNPTQPQEAIPPHACVRSFPIVERYRALWIWMGDPAEADPDQIPDYNWYDREDWYATTDYMHVKSNYLLLVDNLIDLTHINYTHGDIFGNAEMAKKTTSTTVATKRGLVEKWWIPEVPAGAVYYEMVKEPWIFEPVDFRLDMFWEPAANLYQDFYVSPAGRPKEEGTRVINLNCLTPETETSTHYFWGQAHEKRPDSVAYGSLIMSGAEYAFGQDKRLLEALQANIGDQWDILEMHPVINKSDRGALRARRIMRKLIEGGQTVAQADQEETALIAAE